MQLSETVRPGHAALATSELPRPVGKLVALVPAHNEEDQIGETISSLLSQTLPPDEIIVIADNCSDHTVSIATGYEEVQVLETVNNQHKKAGGLNQALDVVLNRTDWSASDAILVMDADSALSPEFLEAAVRRLSQGDVGAVGGTFFGKPGGGAVGMFQRNEYARYARDVGRLQGNVLVLTGTATVFRSGVLNHVRWARANGVVPGGGDAVYDTHVLTEDNELTLAITHLGYSIVSPLGCRLTTDVMSTWRDLAQQRLRWKRGALENLADYGLTQITLRYWVRQLLSVLGVLVIFTYLATLIVGLALTGTLALSPIWLAVTAVFAIERVVSVRSRGLVQMGIAVTIVIEMAYDVFLQYVQARAFIQAALRSEKTW